MRTQRRPAALVRGTRKGKHRRPQGPLLYMERSAMFDYQRVVDSTTTMVYPMGLVTVVVPLHFEEYVAIIAGLLWYVQRGNDPHSAIHWRSGFGSLGRSYQPFTQQFLDS